MHKEFNSIDIQMRIALNTPRHRHPLFVDFTHGRKDATPIKKKKK